MDLLFPPLQTGCKSVQVLCVASSHAIEHHWYLLGIDWIDGVVCIYNSIASSGNHKCLFEFCTELLNFIAEDLKLNSYDWDLFPEMVSSFHHSLTRF